MSTWKNPVWPLHKVIPGRGRPVGLGHHSDHGSQYCFHGYKNLFKQFKIKSSMSGKGNWYDNDLMESFWSTLKSEFVFH
jgi:transposase InsO family protein